MTSTNKNLLLLEEFFFRRFVARKVEWLLKEMPTVREVKYYTPFIYYDSFPSSEDFAKAGHPEVKVQFINTTISSGTIELLRSFCEFEVPTVIVYKEEEDCSNESKTELVFCPEKEDN